MERTHFFVSGIVQGVGFRWYAAEIARALPLSGGFVRNLPDGRVEIAAEGAPAVLAEFERRLRAGALGPNITAVERRVGVFRGDLAGFRIRR